VFFFTEGQVALYIEQCKPRLGATVHIEATGSVVHHIPRQKTIYYHCMLVNHIPQQKTIYYYCMLLADSNLLILDILT